MKIDIHISIKKIVKFVIYCSFIILINSSYIKSESNTANMDYV